MRLAKIASFALVSSLLFAGSGPSAWAASKPRSIDVLTTALVVKCYDPMVYRNYSIGDARNWVKVKPYLKGTTHYWGIMFEGGYSIVAVTMGTKSATLKISNNGERFLRYVSGCPSKMSITYKYVNEYGYD